MIRFLVLCLAVSLVSGCGDEPRKADSKPEAATSYSFDRRDLYREEPRDICRQEDPDFIRDLMSRVDHALPFEAKASAQFDRFWVEASPDGKGRRAVLRFTARHKGEEAVQMFAFAPFVSCDIGPMRASVGGNLFVDDGKQAFDIP